MIVIVQNKQRKKLTLELNNGETFLVFFIDSKMLAASFLIFVCFAVQLHPSNGLGINGDDDNFFQHVFYEVDEPQNDGDSVSVGDDTNVGDPTPKTTRLEHEINLLQEKVEERVSKILSPTIFDVPPPFKEYARMARYVVHNSGRPTLKFFS